MLGEHAYTQPVTEFAASLKDVRARLEKLERLAAGQLASRSFVEGLGASRLAIVSGTKTAVTSTNTSLDTMVDEYDPNGWATAAGVTPPAGYYSVTLQVDWQTMGATTDRVISVLQCGGVTFTQNDSQAGSGSPNRTISGVVYANGSQLIRGIIFQASGADRTADVRMSVHRI